MKDHDAIPYLYNLPRFEKTTEAYKPGLEKMRRMLAEMGDPHQKFRSAHVAGTNGKGSTSSFLAAICTAYGWKTGLYTSPHIHNFTERIRINGQEVPATWLTEAVHRWKPLFEAEKPSFFEAVTALAFEYFAEQQVDFAVIETGLGGRLDATNVLLPEATLITNIGYDHMQQLGHVLPDIAAEKAGIMKPHVPCFTTATQPEVRAVLQAHSTVLPCALHEVLSETTYEVCNEMSGNHILSVYWLDGHYSNLHIGLWGAHQDHNAILALRTAAYLLPKPHDDAIRSGLADVQSLAALRGRFQVIGRDPLILADVGHNAEGLGVTLAEMRRWIPNGSLWVLLGLMDDKVSARLIQVLKQEKTRCMTVSVASPRGMGASHLADVLQKQGLEAHPVADVVAGLARFRKVATPEDGLLITGSHMVVGEVPPALLRNQ